MKTHEAKQKHNNTWPMFFEKILSCLQRMLPRNIDKPHCHLRVCISFCNMQLRFPVSNKQIQRSPIWKNDHIGRLWISDELVHHDHPESFFYVQPLWFWSQITNGTKLKFHLLKIVYTSLKKYRNTISHNNGPTRPAKCTGMKACQDQELEWVL